jgi:hypothetical protein
LIHLLDTALTHRNFKRASLLRRVLTRAGWSVRKAGTTETAGTVADFKEPQGNMRVELVIFGAIITAWLAIAYNICRSLNWL